MKTLRDAAKAALDCQDACNLSGVVFTFAKAMQIICDESNRRGEGTHWKNTHPVVILFVDKLADMSGARLINLESNSFSVAYAACKVFVETEPDRVRHDDDVSNELGGIE